VGLIALANAANTASIINELQQHWPREGNCPHAKVPVAVPLVIHRMTEVSGVARYMRSAVFCQSIVEQAVARAGGLDILVDDSKGRNPSRTSAQNSLTRTYPAKASGARLVFLFLSARQFPSQPWSYPPAFRIQTPS
jgi:hypothetical protein